jgi:tetratricopeptide (TPR) repeat protein
MSAQGTRSALDDLRAAVAGRLPREAGRDAVYRLLVADRSGADPDRVPDRACEAAIDQALDGLPERLDARERERAAATTLATLLEVVGHVSPGEARARAAGVDAALRPALVRELVRLADAAALDEPAHGVVLAGVAVAAAEAARPGAHELEAHDLRAEARRSLAEAAFRGGDLLAAEGALGEARRLAGLGTRDPLLRGELLRVEAEIRCDQSRFAEARRLAQRSVALFRHHGDRRREGRGRVSLALKLAYEGRLDESVAEAGRAIALIDPELDGRWLLAAEFNRAYWLDDAGDTAAARAALPRLVELVAAHGKALDRVRLDWLRARMAAAEGDLATAAELYRPVLERCLELETIYDSATVALELAVVLLELGRADEVLPLADTVAPIFRAQGVEPEAAAAVILAAESLRRGVAAREVLTQLVAARGAARRGR